MRVETRLREVKTMPKYMFIFRGGAPEIPNLSPTEMEAHLRKWYTWAGELAKELRHRDPDELAHEFSDVLAWLASLANLTDVDLGHAVERYATGCPRCGASPCRCDFDR